VFLHFFMVLFGDIDKIFFPVKIDGAVLVLQYNIEVCMIGML
jgi:hypothetical protein